MVFSKYLLLLVRNVLSANHDMGNIEVAGLVEFQMLADLVEVVDHSAKSSVMGQIYYNTIHPGCK